MAEQYYEGIGRRKRSTARVRLYTAPYQAPPAAGDLEAEPGPVGTSGEVIVNGKPAADFFPRLGDLERVLEPLHTTGLDGSFFVSVLVKGGGVTGQTDAVRHGLARALLKSDPELRSVLRKGGFLTRDARVKERKKPGLKRARKAPQYTKR
jgi:small subunit ribosomal protein S9